MPANRIEKMGHEEEAQIEGSQVAVEFSCGVSSTRAIQTAGVVLCRSTTRAP